MLSSSEYEAWRIRYYKGEFANQRLGQAFCEEFGYIIGKRPILYFCSVDSTAENIIRENFVGDVVHTWTIKDLTDQPFTLHLEMSKVSMRLVNDTYKICGTTVPLTSVASVDGEYLGTTFFFGFESPFCGKLFIARSIDNEHCI